MAENEKVNATEYVEGVTSKGFKYKFPKERLDNWELVGIIGEIENDKIWRLDDAFRILLGEDEYDALKENAKDTNGVLKASVLSKEFYDIFTNNDELKKS